MITAGLWGTKRRLVVALSAEDGDEAAAVASASRGQDGCCELALWLEAKGVAQIVTTDEIAGASPIAQPALRHGMNLWLVPARVVEGVRQLAALTDRPAKHSAALLARWPTVAIMRPYLRLVPRADEDRQLGLWREPNNNHQPARKISPEQSFRSAPLNPPRNTSVRVR